jgi:hypothetical protein
MPVNFAINHEGEVVIHRSECAAGPYPDRFESARGKADVKWRTEDLMQMLRGDD